jgi:predicted amidohydrolase YtcJ
MFFQGRHQIQNLYDSHVHWLYTGQVNSSWKLRGLSPAQILQVDAKDFMKRGNWIYGFGWDESQWSKDFKIDRHFLDQRWPDTPVFLSRADGHSSWLNTSALKILGIYHDEHTGILKESDHIKALIQIPDFSLNQKYEHLKTAAQLFNQAGFSYIRDMTSSTEQWDLHKKLILEINPPLHVEHWFVSENLDDLEFRIQAALECQSSQNKLMKMRGIKLFIDGSLGSHTAFLSQDYQGHGGHGQMNWQESEIEQALQKVWSSGLEVAVHSLGDEATDRVVRIARKVYAQGIQGKLHLEHVEILRTETLQLMKPLHIRCHLQPCHWESDKNWLKEKLPKLWKFSFPWSALEKNKIPFSFGSDSPIEKSDFFQNLNSLKNAEKEGILTIQQSPIKYHTYPFDDGPKFITNIENDEIVSVCTN